MSWKVFIAACGFLFALSGIQETAAAPLPRQEIRFRIGKSAVDSSYKKNAATLEWAQSQLSREGLRSITIRAAASPDGSTALNRRLARERAEAVVAALKEIEPSLSDSLLRIEVTGEDWNALSRLVSRSQEPWRDQALELIQSGGAQRKQLLQELYVGEAWDAMRRQYFAALRNVEICFNFETEVSYSKEDKILFPAGIGWISKTYANNKALLEGLQTTARSGADTLYIKGYASPEGSCAANLALTQKRAASVRKFLIAEGFPAERIVIESKGEDWAGLTAAVRESGAYPEVLSVLENDALSSAQKKAQIRSLDGGALWKELIGQFGRQLRAVEVGSGK